MNKRKTGSYYSSKILTEFIFKRIKASFLKKNKIHVLEPSVGDGAFVEQINKLKCKVALTAIDISSKELLKAKTKNHHKYSRFITSDFLDYTTSKKVDLVIGNPPFIKKSLLSKSQIKKCEKIHDDLNFSRKSIKNIWVTFLIKCVHLLNKDGVLAMVLPSDFLQLNFTKEIREFIVSHFSRSEIYTFDDLLFECKGQDTIVLICFNEHKHPGFFVKNVKDLEEEKFTDINEFSKSDLIRTKFKWTHHYLSSDELTLIENIRKESKKISDYTISKPGIVTAANSYFILNEKDVKKYRLKKHTIPVIQKGAFVNGKVTFSDQDLRNLEKKNIPTRLLKIDNKERISSSLKKYLKIGESLDIDKRYKCKERSNWYVIPNIQKKPEAFFFKRSHLYPKLLANNSDAVLTDSAYYIQMLDKSKESLIYSFYNSMTLMFAELDGRFYGGGVLELTPREFKNLPIPMATSTKKQFNIFSQKFKNKNTIEDILHANDPKILQKSLKLTTKEIEIIQRIRNKLLNRRIRNQ